MNVSPSLETEDVGDDDLMKETSYHVTLRYILSWYLDLFISRV